MSQNVHQYRILIIDFGSQYTALIARRIRELGVYCELRSHHCNAEDIRRFAPHGIILSGGPESVTEQDTPRAADIFFQLGVPVLGICYGMQTMAVQFGGQVANGTKKEFGYAPIEVIELSPLLNGLKPTEQVWMSHGDKVTELPADFKIIARSPNSPIAIMANENKRYYAVQFHPEVTHTACGLQILRNFIFDICGCQPCWTTETIIESLIDDIRLKVGSDKVILGLSGGVDSSVLALLLQRAIGAQLTCIFVDTGLVRENEANQVVETFIKDYNIKVQCIDSKKQFLDKLAGVNDPEQKRKIIGNEFITVFEEAAGKLTDARWLAQGTIYPDVIESAAAGPHAKVIKSHHNVGGLPDDLNLLLLEPFRELFKDEVRKLGEKLGLSHAMVYRHPFPGPGLAVRIMGEVKEEYLHILRQADAILIEELHRQGWYEKTSQAFAVFLPVKSVGVVGDDRQYEYVIALRAVETIDFMTAQWVHLPYEFLGSVSRRIVNEVRGVSRVVYDITDKPPATIEWE